jgi:hypothetical protein
MIASLISPPSGNESALIYPCAYTSGDLNVFFFDRMLSFSPFAAVFGLESVVKEFSTFEESIFFYPIDPPAFPIGFALLND